MPRLSSRNVGGSYNFNATAAITVASPATLSTTAYAVNFWYKSNLIKSGFSSSPADPGFTPNEGWFARTGSLSYGRQGTNDVQVYAYLNAPADFAGLRRLRFRNFYFPKCDGAWHMRTLVFYVSVGGSAQCDEYEDAVKLGATHTVDYTGDTGTPSGAMLIGSQGGNLLNQKMSDIQFINGQPTVNDIKTLYYSGVQPTSFTALDRFQINEMTGTNVVNSGTNSTGSGTIVAGASGAWSVDRPFANRNSVTNVNSSLRFNSGAGDRIVLAKNSTIDISSGTIYTRFKTGGAGASYRGVVVKLNAYGIFLVDNILSIYDWGTVTQRSTGINLANNAWHDVCVTFQSGVTNGTNIYLNGQLVLQTTMTVVLQDQGLSIGAGDTGGGQGFAGNINYTAILPTVLTPAQVLAFYNTKNTSIAKAVEYKLNEGTGTSATDSSGNNNTGTITGATWSTDRPFANRKVVRNDHASQLFTRGGTTGKVQVKSGAILSGLTDFSITALVKTNIGAGNSAVVYCERAGAGNDILKLETLNTTGTIQVTYRDDAGTLNQPSFSNKSVKDSAWHYIGISKSGTALSIYADGQLLGTGTLTATNTFTNSNIISGIGFDIADVNATFDGNLKEVRLYNVALTASEMQSMQVSNVRITRGLLDEYLLDEGAGTIAYDTAGTNPGTISGATSWSSDTPSKARKFVGGNMIPNGDFSYVPVVNVAQTTGATWLDGTSGGSATNSLFRWAILTGTYGGTFSANFDTTTKYGNSPSIKLSMTAINSSVDVAQMTVLDATNLANFGIKVLPNTSYTVTHAMKTNYVSGSSEGAKIKITERDASNGNNVTTFSTIISSTTTDWTLYTTTFVTASTTRYVVIRPSLVGSSGTGTLIMDAWFANISLVPTSQLTASALSRLPSSRLAVDGSIIPNGDFSYYPSPNVATTASGVWVDGTAGGSATRTDLKWAVLKSGTTAVLFDTTTKYSDNASMKLSTTAITSWIEMNQSLDETASNIILYAPKAISSRSYNYSFRMKTNYVSGDSSDGAFVAIREFNGAGTAVATTTSTKVKVTSDWTYYSGTFTTSATTAFMYPRLTLYGHTGTGTLIMDAWIDDVSITAM